MKSFQKKEDRRISFIFDRLQFLNKQLKEHNNKVLVFYGNVVKVIKCLIDDIEPSHLIAGAGYEAYDLKRDNQVSDYCKSHNVEFLLKNDHLIFSPDAVVKDDGSSYKVFTPYSRKLYKKILSEEIKEYKVQQFLSTTVTLSDQLKAVSLDLNYKEKSLEKMGYMYTSYAPWKCDFIKKDMKVFANKISDYKQKRDFLDVDGTSRLSPYLRFGFISIRDCLRLAMFSDNSFPWVNELMWREFYGMVLYFYPQAQDTEFLERYQGMPWGQDTKLFERFVSGRTGFPVIDAAMRQLKLEGWVHNRARMLVASFLTKCLFIDWRWGEKLYAQELMDYELSSNVGGWQWGASTGFDAQPYFRIFNPILQGQKFDPEGVYVKKFVPELRDVPSKYIHTPSKFNHISNYPEPIIDYSLSRKRAIAMYKRLQR